jgi:hypothetical protein
LKAKAGLYTWFSNIEAASEVKMSKSEKVEWWNMVILIQVDDFWQN